MNNESFGETLVDVCASVAEHGPPTYMVDRVADAIRCAFAAEQASDDASSPLTKYRALPQESCPCGEGATIWATGDRCSAQSAAFRNGIAVRLLDMNDTYVARAIVHPSDVIPALVAIAENAQQPWERLLSGIQIAYEVVCRFADVVDLTSNGFEAATLSPLATALAGSWIVGADRSTTVEAVRLAALDAATLGCTRQGELSDWKGMSSARGAVKGMFALEMARVGITAPAEAFESRSGFLNRVAGSSNFPTDSQNRVGRTLYKAFPAQIFIQTPLLLMQSLLNHEKLSQTSIRRVTVHAARLPVKIVGAADMDGLPPTNRESADHNLRFCLAAMLVYGRLTTEDFEAGLGNPELCPLMSRIEVLEDGAYTEVYPQQIKARVEVLLVGGRRLAARGSAEDLLFRRPWTSLSQGAQPESAMVWPFSLPGELPTMPRIH